MGSFVKILIVDDHPFFRRGVRLYLGGFEDFEVVGEATCAAEALQFIAANAVDVVLMDIKMPGQDGISATDDLLRVNPSLRILVLTSYGGEEKIRQAIKAGAAGYCLKDAPPEELAAAIRAVAAGGTYLGQGIAPEFLVEDLPRDKKPEGASTEAVIAGLTRRELDVLKLLARGLSNKEIAGQLVVSEKTVKTHVANLLQKLEVRTRTQAALLAHRYGL